MRKKFLYSKHRHGVSKAGRLFRLQSSSLTCPPGIYCFTLYLFGLTSLPLHRHLQFGRSVLLSVLKREPTIRVFQPQKNEEFIKLVAAVAVKYCILVSKLVYTAIDGCKLYLKQFGSELIQIYLHNGWKSNHYVNTLFVFTPPGMFRSMVINCPGINHDVEAANFEFIYEELLKIHKKCCG
eukprot:15362109-Ditylum_brightwellii.AAC.1